MKKLLILLLCPLLLCGCRQKPNGYLITAIAIDYDGGLYTVWYEAIITNTEKSDQKREVLSARGFTYKEAIREIEKQATEEIILSHCGAVIIGDGITRLKLVNIIRYCKEHGDITLSIQFLRCGNIEKLLKTDPLSSVSVGYDLVSMLKTQKPNEKNRLFEIYKNQNPILSKIKLTEKGYYFE